MAIQSKFYTPDGTTLNYPQTKHIPSKMYVRVLLQDISNVWTPLDANSYDLIYNSVVLYSPVDTSVYKSMEVRVADTEAELTDNASAIAIVASIYSSVVTVSTIATEVTTLAGIDIELQSLYADKVTLDSLYADKTTLDSLFADKSTLDSLYADKAKLDSLYADKTTLDSLFTSLANIDSVRTNIADVIVASDNITDIVTVSTNIADVTTVGANLNKGATSEILNAEANGLLAASKAGEAATSASNAAISETNAANNAASVNANNIIHKIGSGLANEGYTKTEADIALAKIQGDNTKTFKVSDAVNPDEAVSKAQLDLKATLAEAQAYDLGVGQTWQDVTASRSVGVTYTNTTGKPIALEVQCGTISTNTDIRFVINGTAQGRTGAGVSVGTGDQKILSTIIPDGATYACTVFAGSFSIGSWFELR